MKRLLSLYLALLIPPFLIAADERPNIVVIMPDDQGYGDLGATGNPVIRTPHIDALATESATLTDFYVCPVCSPTRASVMTGRYHYRTRVVDTFKGRSMMDPNETTLAELLGNAGYRTGIFGKWHLGDNYPLRPNDQGFDESLIHKGGGLAQPSEPLENARRYTNPILFHNGSPIETLGYCTDLYFDAAMQFIDQAAAEEKPFFVYLPPNAPHGPYHDVPAEPYEYYKSIDLSPVLGGRQQDADRVARIYAMIENIDTNVGRLRHFLAEKELAENTLILFLVDNGPNTRRYVGPFRGMKSEVYEGGIRSPFYASWPARLRAGTRSDRISAHIDILPTVLDAAGVSLPDDLEIDGRSMLPLLEGKTEEVPDRAIFLQVHRGDEPIPFHHIAVRTQRWKLVHPTGFQNSEMPDDIPFELYEIPEDPRELNDLADAHPEIVTAMKKRYRSWFDNVSNTRTDNFAPPRIVIGAEAEPVSFLTRQDWRVDQQSGWGRGGKWLVDFKHPGPYEVQLVFDKELPKGEATLKMGDMSQQIRVDEPTQRVKVEVPRAPTGETTVSAIFRNGEKERDPYQIIFSADESP